MPTPEAKERDITAATALEEEQSTAQEFTDEFKRRSFDFDADEAVRTAAEGAFEFLRTDIEEGVEDLRGSQVGRGRLSTGFGFEDEDRLVRDIFDRFNAEVARNSLQAAQLNLQNQGQLGDFSNLSRNRFLDFLSGERDRDVARENAKEGPLDFLGSAADLAGKVIPFF